MLTFTITKIKKNVLEVMPLTNETLFRDKEYLKHSEMPNC